MIYLIVSLFSDNSWISLDTFNKYDSTKTRSTLIINSLELNDQGHYRCLAENGVENVLVKQVDLLIKGNKKEFQSTKL